MRALSVAAAQTVSTRGAVTENVEHHCQLAELAAAEARIRRADSAAASRPTPPAASRAGKPCNVVSADQRTPLSDRGFASAKPENSRGSAAKNRIKRK